MTISYFPFDSGAGADVQEAEWAEMARLWLFTGVYNSNGVRPNVDLNKFEVYGDNSGLQVKVKTGTAWIEGFYVKSDAEEIVALATADATNPRKDRIILKLDRGANTITLTKLTGTPAGSPVAPTLTQNSSIWEISLAQVLVVATDTLIAAGDVTDEREFVGNVSPITQYPRGHLSGMELSNNTTDASNDIDISVGSCRDDADAANIDLASAMTKRLDAAWAEGSSQGGLDTGAKANSTFYHVFAIRNGVGTVDVLFSTSLSSPTMPSGYAAKRRLGSIKTDGSGNILAFIQAGDRFYWKTPVLDVNVTNLSTSRVTYTLTSVPTGFRLIAVVNLFASGVGGRRVHVSNPDMIDLAPSSTAAPLFERYADTDRSQRTDLLTDASGQITARADLSSTTFRVAVLGWIDPRGK